MRSVAEPTGPTKIPPILDLPEPNQAVSRTRWLIHLLLIGAFPVAVGLLSFGRGAGAKPALGRGVKQLLMVSTVEIAIFGVVFALAWSASRASKEALLLRWRPKAWVIPLGLGYSVALRIGVAIVILLVSAILLLTQTIGSEELQKFLMTNRPDVEALVDTDSLAHNPAYFWLSVTLVSFIVGGLREELWRAAFLASLRQLWPARFCFIPGQILGVLLAAIAFGLGHLAQGLVAVCLTGLLGIGLGVIMVVHRSIWPAVLAHGFFNAASFALIPLVLDKLPQFR
jgi:membrane protease YdiL (CAAX protease family)